MAHMLQTVSCSAMPWQCQHVVERLQKSEEGRSPADGGMLLRDAFRMVVAASLYRKMDEGRFPPERPSRKRRRLTAEEDTRAALASAGGGAAAASGT